MTLHDYIIHHLQTPFEWGKNDCVLFVGRWAEMHTGKEYLPKTLWKTEIGAQRKLKQMGGLEAVFDARFRRIEPNYAKDGDIGLVDGVACLFSGSHVVGLGMQGMIHVSRRRAQHAWTY